MTRIILLTAILIAAFTVNAFAVDPDDTVDVSLTIGSYVTINTTGGASEAITDADYPQNPGDADTTVAIDDTSASAAFSANQNFTITPTTGEEFGTTTLYTKFGTGSFVKANGTEGAVHTGGAINNDTKAISFEIRNVNGASLPSSENNEVVTVTFTIAAI